ncbi:MAG: hypothetical protein AVO33_02530 [delta proteobacterium ML8_F1]|nr:MAG: hypothetical protein AVO33_02530 [delta proteobacterium ML8_F1]
MFREMRRKDKQMAPESARALLKNQCYGILSVMGEEGYPYGVPVNYVYFEDAIIFHSALSGHKIQGIQSYPRVSFTVVGENKVNARQLSTEYESVVIFGEAVILEGEEKQRALLAFGEHFASDFMAIVHQAVKKEFSITQMVRIDIHHLTGKKALE